MKTTPLDIRKQKFGRQFRGYNRTEVETFLDMVASEMETLTRKSNEMEEKLRVVEARLENYRNIETALQSTLLTSQRQAEDMIKNAEERGELILRRAKLQSEKLYEKAYKELSSIKTQIEELKGLKGAFGARFKSLLETHKRLIEEALREESEPSEKMPPRKALITEEEIDQAVEEFKTASGVSFSAEEPSKEASGEKE